MFNFSNKLSLSIMPKIINIPDFMEVEILDKNYNFLQTFLLFLKSRILIVIFKYSNKDSFLQVV